MARDEFFLAYSHKNPRQNFVLWIIFSFVCMHFCFLDSLEARLYFMHVPKTAGTSLRLLLEQQLSTEEIYPFRNISHAKGSPVQELISGHFPYWFCEKLDNQFQESFKITVLRDPVERYLSFLRAKKNADTQLTDLESVMKLRFSKNNRYRGGLTDNAICKHLTNNPFLKGEALLESAKQTLQKLDCIIFFDTFSQDVIALFKRFGIDLNENDIPKINVNRQEPVNDQLLEEVIKCNALDIQLYEYARKNHQKKNSKYSLRTKSYETIVKKTNRVDYTFNLPLNGRGWTYRETMTEKNSNNLNYRWVMDQPAYIYFPLEAGCDYDLYMRLRPLTSEVLPRVRVNGKEIELTKLNDELFSLYHGKIPLECVTTNFTEISFYSSCAFRYRDIYPQKYNNNYPPLSFAVSQIIIVPLSSQ